MEYKVTYLLSADAALDALLSTLQTSARASAKATYFELDSVTQQLATFPYAYQATENPTIRRAFLNTAEHTLYFRIKSRKVIVLAVLPQRMGLTSLRKRGLVS